MLVCFEKREALTLSNQDRPMTFNVCFQKNIDLDEPAFWFVFHKDNILTVLDGEATKPMQIRGNHIASVSPENALHVGVLNGVNCYAVSDDTGQSVNIPNTAWVPLRQSLGRFDEEMFLMYGRARQLLTWAENNRFCGRCGNPMSLKQDERCLVCSACGNISFPRISPAVIVAVEKDGKLLLARSQRFHSKMYSVLAGFVEPGESLEDCVRREIKEEVGIDVDDIRYFKSQPWPFPDSLMVGFTARYAGGEILVDSREIDDAGWFSPDAFPMLPGKISIARALIDHFAEKMTRGDRLSLPPL